MEGTVIATAANPRDLWTCFLLIASLRRHGNAMQVHVNGQNLEASASQYLTQFSDIAYRDYSGQHNLLKSHSLSRLGNKNLFWIDPDHIVVGKLKDVPLGLQVRWRTPIEMRVYAEKRLWNHCSELSYIPGEILQVWQQDVGEREEASTTSLCSLSAFCVHRSQKNFLHRWDQLIRRLLRRSDQYLLPDTMAYGQIDEASFNALMAYLHEAPSCADYTLGSQLLQPSDRKAHLAAVIDTLQWARSEGYQLPEIPRMIRQRLASRP